MISLLRLVSWRHARRRPLRLALGVLSVALGVALFVSVEVAQHSARRAFEGAARRLAGKAELRVTRGRGIGIEAGALARIEEIPGVLAAPVLEMSTRMVDLENGPLLVLGIDFVRDRRLRDFSAAGGAQVDPVRMALDPSAAMVTRALSERHGLTIGSTLRVSTPHGLRSVRVAGLLEATGPATVFGGNLAVMGIGGAQRLFGREGFYDRIEVAPAGAAEPLRAKLGPDYRVEPARAGSSMLEDALSRVRALMAVSVIALLVGLFIVYLSVSIGVVERGRDIGTMRALGATRGQIAGLFLIEAAALGAAGSALGVAMGWALARLFIDYVARGINLLIFVVDVREAALSPAAAAAAAVAGTLTALAAALVPALGASRVAPVEALRPASMAIRSLSGYRRGFATGVALLALGIAGVLLPARALPAWGTLAETALVFLGLGLALPQVTVWLSRAFRAPLRTTFRIEGYLAADNVMKNPRRTALTVTVLGGALSMMVATASILSSLRRATDAWMDRSFPFDLSVQATDLSQSIYSSASLPGDLVDRVARVEGARRAYAVKAALVEYGRSDIMLLAIDMASYFEAMRARGLRLVGYSGTPDELAPLVRGEAVGVSGNFAALHGVRPGDEIELSTPAGARRFRVSHAIEDYSWPQGLVAIDLGAYRAIWKDPSVTYIDLTVAPGQTAEAVRARLAAALEGEFRAFVYSTADIRRYAHGALDASFRLVDVQVVIAMIIGFLGIVNTVLISVMRRTREIGLLRAVGMTRAQVSRTIVESVFVAFVGGLVGVAGGLLGAAFPLSAHVLRITGYLVPFVVPWGTVVGAMAAALAIGFLSSLVPARRAAGLNVLEAVGYE